jgi:hypothetical protein
MVGIFYVWACTEKELVGRAPLLETPGAGRKGPPPWRPSDPIAQFFTMLGWGNWKSTKVIPCHSPLSLHLYVCAFYVAELTRPCMMKKRTCWYLNQCCVMSDVEVGLKNCTVSIVHADRCHLSA